MMVRHLQVLDVVVEIECWFTFLPIVVLTCYFGMVQFVLCLSLGNELPFFLLFVLQSGWMTIYYYFCNSLMVYPGPCVRDLKFCVNLWWFLVYLVCA